MFLAITLEPHQKLLELILLESLIRHLIDRFELACQRVSSITVPKLAER